jgi:2-hydroxy-6-oxonona-2,4-dienedioate hydrolase
MIAQYVDVNGARTRYFEAGSGEPLVLVHGGEIGAVGGAGALLWDRNLEGLARHFRVVAFDRLGEGHTDAPKRDEDYSAEAVARHVHDFLVALRLERAHLVGQSRGAYWVTRVAVEHPEMVMSLVLCNSATLAPGERDLERRRAAIFADTPADPREAIVHRWSRLSFTTDHITRELVDAMLALSELPKNREAAVKMATLRQRQWLPGLERQKQDTLTRIRAGGLALPVLIVWGSDDPQAVLDNGLDLYDLFGTCNAKPTRMYVLGRAGHFHFREHADEFNRVVTEFLRTHGPRA